MSSALLAFVPTGPPQLESRPRVNRSHRVGHSDDNAADSRRCMVAGSLLGLMMAVAPASSKRLPESRGVKTVDDLAHEGFATVNQEVAVAATVAADLDATVAVPAIAAEAAVHELRLQT
eukprot:CAMPEP_0197654124 /NCGR_PEP_ID=MMETSP1338-20131121/38665_1 /TAXON_ID=43686 ORGANISM="Pelagodinium beii, Strain RCC1491" /NCGR_SAMPLE_ID=MMETSP1338 /ASSEMBLY_ACC=CAM_ASM_000754 /LENGTH=118 /DNA_ID=CAMNT_0043229511 /DNA_START=101 /DNA_END=458 /DNA_ORIENTATION=-